MQGTRGSRAQLRRYQCGTRRRGGDCDQVIVKAEPLEDQLEQVANAAGLSLSDVGRIERGERDPGVRVLTKLAHGLGVETDALLRDNPT